DFWFSAPGNDRVGRPSFHGQNLTGTELCRGGGPAPQGRAGGRAGVLAGNECGPARTAHVVFPRPDQHEVVTRGIAFEKRQRTAANGGSGGRILKSADLHR